MLVIHVKQLIHSLKTYFFTFWGLVEIYRLFKLEKYSCKTMRWIASIGVWTHQSIKNWGGEKSRKQIIISNVYEDHLHFLSFIFARYKCTYIRFIFLSLCSSFSYISSNPLFSFLRLINSFYSNFYWLES